MESRYGTREDEVGEAGRVGECMRGGGGRVVGGVKKQTGDNKRAVVLTFQ